MWVTAMPNPLKRWAFASYGLWKLGNGQLLKKIQTESNWSAVKKKIKLFRLKNKCNYSFAQFLNIELSLNWTT